MPLSWNEIRDRAVAFVREWGDESSEDAEAKSFWDDFFEVFGVNRRRVASFEHNVKKAGGRQGFIDLFWPGMLLAEHKSRGGNLDSAFTQATDYFPGLSDKELPRYIIVSDFARFRVRNLDTDEAVEFPITDLPKYLSTFGFIAGYEARAYKEQDPVNIKAAEKLAKLHDALKAIGYEGHELEVYLVRLLFCLFADDTGIFMPRSAFEDFVRVRTSEDGSDLAPRLNQLFQVLNTPSGQRLRNLDEQVAAFPYVNGRLFKEQLPQASFDRSMRDILLECCELDWGSISPAIFGSLFQGIMDAKVRRNLGAHYTSEKNILKLIGPLFMDDLRAEFERIKSQPAKLRAFHEKLGKLNFFDPACGCGNFLVISYRELRLLELEVIQRLYSKEIQQLSLDAIDQYVKVDVDQFHGIEIEEWPAQIAQVAMWLIDHQMNLRVGAAFGQTVVRIPLVKSANIIHDNALQRDWNSVLPADRCSFVLGNPPFGGKHCQKKGQREDQAAVTKGIKSGSDLDFVANWFLIAAQYTGASKSDFAFVATSSITQGEQVPLLWPVLYSQYGLKIRFAHRPFQWRNEAKGVAAVHCVIIGLTRNTPATFRLFDYASPEEDPAEIAAKAVNPYLIDGPDIIVFKRTKPITARPVMRCGSKPTDDGNLILNDEERNALIAEHPLAEPWIRQYIGTDEFLYGTRRWCLWLEGVSPSELRRVKPILERLDRVRNFRLSSTAIPTQAAAKTPGRFFFVAQPATDYILVPEVSSERRRYVPIGLMSSDVIASNKVYLVPSQDRWIFGLLQSAMHMTWLSVVGGRLESRFQYSGSMVYNTFPLPLDSTESQNQKIVEAAQGVLDARSAFSEATPADLYDAVAMPPALVKAHEALDRAVDAAYVPSGGKKAWASDAERVAFLFEMYQKLTSLLPAPSKKQARKKAAA